MTGLKRSDITKKPMRKPLAGVLGIELREKVGLNYLLDEIDPQIFQKKTYLLSYIQFSFMLAVFI